MATGVANGHYHFAGQIIRRSDGASSVGAAAYRLRTDLTDERTGERHDYTPIAKDFVFGGVFVDAKAPAWARDPDKLFNRLEQVEKRKDAQLCHEINIGLPCDLTNEQQRYALQDWVKEITRKGYPVLIAIHRAHEWGDQRNDHAHIMIPLRKLDAATNDFSKDKDRYSLKDLSDQMEKWRERWAYHANRHLERVGSETRIDHRSLQDQGIDRTPTVHLGKEAAALERRGVTTERGDHNRAAVDFEKERDRLTREVAELERLYKLEQEAASYKQAEEAARQIEEQRIELETAEIEDRKQADAKIEEIYQPPQHVDAIQRQREEEADEQRRRPSRAASKSVLGLIWTTLASMARPFRKDRDLRKALEGEPEPLSIPKAPPKFDPKFARDEVTLLKPKEQPARTAPPPFDPKHAREEIVRPSSRLMTAAERRAKEAAAARKQKQREDTLRARGIIKDEPTPADRLHEAAEQKMLAEEQKKRQDAAARAYEGRQKAAAEIRQTIKRKGGRKRDHDDRKPGS